MSKVSFYKLSGAGNDFIALVEPQRLPSLAEIRAWCRRALSLGADGVFTLTRTAQGAQMVHYNADGGRSTLCLNGSRCAAQLAFHLGWGKERLELKTDVGVLQARRRAPGTVEIALPVELTAAAPQRMSLQVKEGTHDGFFVEVGVPHFVLPWAASLATAPISTLGSILRAHPELGAPGANVNFVHFRSPDRLEIRTFERGVEAETLACGTGVVAAVAVGVAIHGLRLPVMALTASGCELKVGGAPSDGGLASVTLAGDARIVASGELLPDAAILPEPPRWS